jgi:hypothetical protein
LRPQFGIERAENDTVGGHDDVCGRSAVILSEVTEDLFGQLLSKHFIEVGEAEWRDADRGRSLATSDRNCFEACQKC